MSYSDIHSPFFKWLLNLKKDLLKAKSLEYILIIAVAISIVFGLLEYLIDPNVHSFTDGVWYAWVTMTHVGYGDVVPTSLMGRLMGTLLILFGLGLFAIFAASFSAVLIGKDLGDVRKEMHIVEREAHDIEREESRVLLELVRLHQRLDQLEAKLAAGQKKDK